MTAGEELMVFLEMNGYDISKYKLKKQLSFFKIGKISLIHKKTLEDFLLTYYKSEDLDVLHTNPLIYLDLWKNHKVDKVKVSIFDFYIKHSRIENTVTLQSFIEDATIKEEIKRRILNEIVNKWVQDYKEYSQAVFSNVNEWADLMMRDVEYFRIPTIYKTLAICVVFVVLFLSYFSPITFFNMYNQAILQTLWFNIYFIVAITVTTIYILRTDLFRKKVKNVKVSWKKQIIKNEKKMNKKLEKFSFQFDNLFENEKLISRKKTLKKLNCLKIVNSQVEEIKKQIFAFEKGYNKVLCNYESRLHFKDVSFFALIFVLITYLILGFALSKGWM